ncbi:MAG: protein kinase domain-containing protein [Anaerolineae bacterium]
MTWTEGERVGGYILEGQIGQGGMATVYLGRHPELKRQVAIKVMHQNFLDDEGFVARFKREAQIVAQLSHPHIVPVYDFNEHEGQPYLVMKYVQGWTLKKQLIKDPPNLDGVLMIITKIGDALHYAHEQGILHRDIKPSNIVIDHEGKPYLTDFGLARMASAGESTMSADMLLGTPHYISPEQARGAKKLDRRTDIYSLGVVLYELLVGRVPFTGDSAFSIIHDHIYTPLPAPTQVNPELPSEVERVLYRTLAKAPDDRYESVHTMLNDLNYAVRQSDLTELDPQRAIIAEASLAKIRAEYENQATITPPRIGVESPMGSGSSVRQATLYPKQKPFYDQERFWFISGCGSLLVVTFLSLVVFLGMAGNLQELGALTAGNFSGERNRLDFSTLEELRSMAEDYESYGITIDSVDNIPVLNVPYTALENLPETSNNTIMSLLRAQSLYEEATVREARQEIMNHAPSNTEMLVLYLISASRIAQENDDIEGATVYAIIATEQSLATPRLFNTIRPLTLATIYEGVGTTRMLSLSDAIAMFASDDSELRTLLTDSTITRFATARNLIASGNLRLARTLLIRSDDGTPIDPEFNLLRAELALQSNNLDEAESLLNVILDDNDSPQWVRDRALTLQELE